MPDSHFEAKTGFYRPDIINDIRASVAKTNKRLEKHGLDATIFADEKRSKLLLIKTGDEWMRQEYGKPMPRKLFGDLWLEGELCILFADTNLGKSILAVQIGYNLAKCCHTEPFANQLDKPARVLYVDFELSAKQFESRYYHPQHGSLHFGDNFYRAEFNPEAENPALYDNYNQYLASQLEWAITKTRATVLIIDNLTYMRAGTERAKDALPLMKQLKALKTLHKLSMLVLAHTPKRNPAKPLTVNDLQGSKILINFCDSAFAIGESQSTPGHRYFKQIKQRSSLQQYGEDNVCVAHIQKDLNNLVYVVSGYAREEQHLQKVDRRQLKHDAQQLRRQGQSYRQICKQLGLPLSTVASWFADNTDSDAERVEA
jgi:RecA-family ATPase